MATDKVWLPPPSELGPVPPPPGEEPEEFEIIQPVVEENATLELGELPIISHNISLLESQLQFISNTKGMFNKQSSSIELHITEMQKYNKKLQSFLTAKQNDSLVNRRLISHLSTLKQRIENCLIQYDHWERTHEVQEEKSLDTQPKRLSQPWGSKTNPTKGRRKRGTSILGQARENQTENSPESSERKLEAPEREKEINNEEEIFIEREEIQGECSICWEDMTNSTISETREFMLMCGHSFCFKCLNSLCMISTYDPMLILDLGCPWEDCDHNLDDSEVEFLVDPGTFQDYERNHFFALKQKDPNTRYCNKPECSALIETDVTSFPRIVCPSCSGEYCFHCKRKWHGEEASCEETKNKEKQEEPDNSALQFEAWVEENNAKPCPQCNIMIEKVSGCNHMKCKACKHGFCWLCMETYSSSHYSKGNCAGKQFYGVTYSYTANPARYARDNSNPDVEPPAIYRPEIVRKNSKHSHRSSLGGKKKKRRILALPALFPRRTRSNSNRATKTTRSSEEIHICMLGDSGVGKSPFVLRFVQNHYVDEYDPTIEDSYRKQIKYDGQIILLDILDTCGLEEFSAMRDQWLRGAEAFIICFSCTREASIEEIRPLVEQISRVKDEEIQNLVILIAGTKFDLEDEYAFNPATMRSLASEFNAPLIFTSARYDVNITEAFYEVVRMVLEKRASAAST